MVGNSFGPIPYGFVRDSGKLKIQPQEACIRRRIFDLFILERRKRTVAEILNAEGYRTRNGGLFSGQTVGRYLTDPIVKGIPGEIEAIVSVELWDQCQTILEEQKSGGGAKRKVAHLFAGYVHCACGQKMYVPSNSDKYVCGECRAKIPTDDVEAVFCAGVSDSGSATGRDIGQIWSSFKFSKKRELVELLTSRIEVQNRDIRLFLHEI